jgi:molybdopterin converting factor small subunit
VAKVHLPPDVARAFADGVTEHELDAHNVRELMRSLDARFPGIAERLGRGSAIAIDGEIFQDWLLEKIRPGSEVRFLPAMRGG